MSSIHGKVVGWTLGTVAFSFVAFAVVSLLLFSTHPGPPDFFHETLVYLSEESVVRYKSGGVAQLDEFLTKMSQRYQAKIHLVNASSRDVIDGQDLSPRIAMSSGFKFPPPVRDGQLNLLVPIASTDFRLLVNLHAPFDPFRFLPYYGAIVLVIALLAYALSAHLVLPIRRLRAAVDRFGQGDLSARANPTRKDEIGDLARAFDQMATRIESLLGSQRRLLQDVSHELRSPLSRLSFAIGLVKSDEDKTDSLQQIERECHRLATLVDQLLDLNRAEGDIDAYDLAPINLDQLVESLIEDSRYAAEARGVRFSLRAEQGAIVHGEWELLRRAVENVLRNAVHYTANDSVIDVEVSSDTADSSTFIKIRDRGPGVPETHLETIFIPFHRVGDDRSRQSGGTGLGLSIARRAIALHGGTIWAGNANPGLCIIIRLL